MITAQHRAGVLCSAAQSSFPDNILQWNSSLPLQHLLYQGRLSNLVWLLCLATWIPSYIFQLKPSEKWPQLSPILWAQLSFHVLHSIIDNCYFMRLGFVSRWKVKSTLVEPLIRGQIVNTLIEIFYVSMNFNKIFFSLWKVQSLSSFQESIGRHRKVSVSDLYSYVFSSFPLCIGDARYKNPRIINGEEAQAGSGKAWEWVLHHYLCHLSKYYYNP